MACLFDKPTVQPGVSQKNFRCWEPKLSDGVSGMSFGVLRPRLLRMNIQRRPPSNYRRGSIPFFQLSDGTFKTFNYKGDAPAGAWIIGFDRVMLRHFKEHSNRRRNIVAIPTLEGCVYISKHQADLWQSINPRPDVAVMAILEIRLGGY